MGKKDKKKDKHAAAAAPESTVSPRAGGGAGGGGAANPLFGKQNATKEAQERAKVKRTSSVNNPLYAYSSALSESGKAKSRKAWNDGSSSETSPPRRRRNRASEVQAEEASTRERRSSAPPSRAPSEPVLSQSVNVPAGSTSAGDGGEDDVALRATAGPTRRRPSSAGPLPALADVGTGSNASDEMTDSSMGRDEETRSARASEAGEGDGEEGNNEETGADMSDDGEGEENGDRLEFVVDNRPPELEVKNNLVRVISAPVSQLVRALADEKMSDNEYIHQFLLTHRYFIDSATLLEQLRARYESVCRASDQDDRTKMFVKLRVINVLKKWVGTPFLGFSEHPELVALLEPFVDYIGEQSPQEKVWADRLLDEAKSGDHRSVVLQKTDQQSSGDGAADELAKGAIEGDVAFIKLHPLEVARQLTLLDHKIFASIRPSELYRCAWAKKSRDKLSPSVVALAERFNRVSFWVATEVITTANAQQRVEVLVRFIEVALHLLDLQNYHGVMQIFASLNLGCVQRLKSAWKEVPKKYLEKMQEIEVLLQQTGNFRNYRDVIKNITPPYLPLQAVVLGDLTSFEEVPDTLDNGYINFEKMRLLSSVLSEVETCQQAVYPFNEVPFVSKFLKDDLFVLGDNELYKLSKQMEQRAQNQQQTQKKKQSFYSSIRVKKRDSGLLAMVSTGYLQGDGDGSGSSSGSPSGSKTKKSSSKSALSPAVQASLAAGGDGGGDGGGRSSRRRSNTIF